MRLFELQTKLTTYTYPIVKIIVCLLVVVFSVVRNRVFHFSNSWVNAIITALCFLLTIASILCLYISVGELFCAYENRKNDNNYSLNIKNLNMDAIIKIVSENDIVEIEAEYNNSIIKIGSSSDCKHGSSVFQNKLFYISSVEYESVDLFTEALLVLFPERVIPVSKIDDLPLKNWRV